VATNFKLIVQYDGTDYCGWQIQKNQTTIQGVLKDCVQKITKKKNVNIIGSGRTDSGVHSLGQVVNFKLRTNMNALQMLKALNAILPKDIKIFKSEIVDMNFNARFSALKRSYLYKINLDESPFNYRFIWPLSKDYNFEVLEECAKIILSKNNFYNFCKSSKDIDNYNCIIYKSCWSRKDKELNYNIIANRFLHHMVRMLVGTMIEVSNGKINVDDFSKLFDSDFKKKNILTAPSKGLYLFKVTY